MASYSKTLITAIEFGTCKITVMNGKSDENNMPEVISFAQASSECSVVKGQIVDISKVEAILRKLLKEADESLTETPEGRIFFVTVNGGQVHSFLRSGTLQLNPSETITAQIAQEAMEKAGANVIRNGEQVFSRYDAYFKLDDDKITGSPVGLQSSQLEAFMRYYTVRASTLSEIHSCLQRIGFDNEIHYVFNGIASVFGTLNDDEMSQGVLLIDLGHGCTDYVLVHGNGVLASGVIPVGIANVANDLHIGLEMPYEQCELLVRNSKYSELLAQGGHFYEYVMEKDKKRLIPLESFEAVVNARLSEIFELIYKEIEEDGLFSYMPNGVVLCGGCAAIKEIESVVKNVFKSPIRIGKPLPFSGANSSFTDAPSSYTAIHGLLRCALAGITDKRLPGMDFLRNKLESLVDSVMSFRKALSK